MILWQIGGIKESMNKVAIIGFGAAGYNAAKEVRR